LAEIELERVTKEFPGCVAVDDISLRIEDGEFLVLVGPSGCGKSTLLRMIAAMVFQSYALYPHMTVRQNLGYGLKVRRSSKAEIVRRVEDVARMLRLEELLDRRPAALSGGQRQRVAMGRAVVREPKAFLMDEPLSNLDAKLRVSMRAELASLHGRLGATTVYVTHDQVEAMTLGQRVAVMRDGRILQVDVPQRLYEEPRDLFVAAFIGSPAMNLVESTIDGDEVVFGQFRVPLHPTRRPARRQQARVVLGIRPEAFGDADLARSDALPRLDVVVEVVEELGSDSHLFFQVDAPPITSETLEATDDRATLLADEKALFNSRVSPGTSARVGDPLSLTVDPGRFHFFDPTTGESLLAGQLPSEQPAEERAPAPV
jgi:multiple sugar transport system ATP-binding protein